MPPFPIASIAMPFDPNITGGTGYALSWHGFLSFVGVAVAVWFVARAARTERGVDVDMVYNTAIWAILGGILGARLVHVADNWNIYGNDPAKILSVWEGGIGLWGGILGGWLAGITYAHFAKYPVGKLMDMTAAPLLLAQAIGRIGDIINGEHCSKALSWAWGWYYTDPNSPARLCISANQQEYFRGGQSLETPVHPAVIYEMMWDVLGLFILYKLRHRLKPHGGLFMFYLAYYAVGRFTIQFIRLDKVYFAGLQEAHLIALGVLAVSVPFMAWKVRFRKGDEESGPDGRDERPDSRRRQERRERRARAQAG